MEVDAKSDKHVVLLIAPVLIAVFMFTLDETISNVALTYIAGSMSVSLNESTWIVTSYLVSSCIAIPSVSFMCRLMGRKSYFITSLVVFIFSSFLCAISNSMVMIVLARFLQGLGGGSLLPLGQSITMEAFPPEERSKAMAIFGFIVIFGPIIGPLLGGWITENYSWPWIYLINIPIGIFTLMLAHYYLEDPPYAKKQKNPNIDFIGIIFLSIWIVFLQVVLDKGNDADWFNTTWICWFFGISCIFGIAIFVSQLCRKNTLVDLTVFKDQNYNIGSWAQTILMAVFLASGTILPSMLQNLLGYTAYVSGLSMCARGLGSLAAVFSYPILSKYVNDKFVGILGITCLSLGGIFFGMINLEISLESITLPNALFGAGLFYSMTALISLSCATIPNEKMTNASGLQNLLKTLGGAVGTSLATTFISRYTQKHQYMLVGNLTDLNSVYVDKIHSLSSAFLPRVIDSLTADYMAQISVYNQMLQQSHLWGYVETFRIFAIACLVMIPLIFLLKSPKFHNEK